jgi:pimeloyl-ACP methyl ester carboxylesterase
MNHHGIRFANRAASEVRRLVQVRQRRVIRQLRPKGLDHLLAARDEADASLETEFSEATRLHAFRAAMACNVARHGPAETAFLDRLCAAPRNPEAVAAMYAEMREGLDLLGGANEVKAPALVIAAESDLVVPPAAVRPIADALPNARYLEFTDAGHFLGVAEASEEFRAAVCAFLTDSPPNRRLDTTHRRAIVSTFRRAYPPLPWTSWRSQGQILCSGRTARRIRGWREGRQDPRSA